MEIWQRAKEECWNIFYWNGTGGHKRQVLIYWKCATILRSINDRSIRMCIGIALILGAISWILNN